MAKKLINYGYTFNVAAGTIVIKEFMKLDDIFLITNVTTNDIIYNFADPAAGGTVTWDGVLEETTINLDMDVNALGTMTDDDRLQIIVDEGNAKMNIDDSFLDPVHKIRVSAPENLIDTDFEYGLQPTKWETLELSNNVPSFYISDGDLAIADVLSINAVDGSRIITVITGEDHSLPVGTPIDVQGLSSRTAEGKFLIASVPTTTSFTFRANAAQRVTGNIGNIYSTVTPGTFYTGSQIPFDPAAGITTDLAEPSTITVTTSDPHGFVTGNQFYLLNSVGGKSVKFEYITTDTAPDGRPYVDEEETLQFSVSPDYTQTETKQMRSWWSTKFDSTQVNTSNNSIQWTNHQLRDNDVVFYMPPVSDEAIGGLGQFEAYYIKKVDDNNIQLTSSYNGAAISFSSAGTSYFGRHSLHLAYEIKYVYVRYRSYQAQSYTRNAYNGTGSGWDLRSTFNGGYGLGYQSGQTVKWVPFARNAPGSFYYMMYYIGTNYTYSPYASSNFNFISSGGVNTANRYNIFEDFTRFSTANYTGYIYLSGSSGQIHGSKYYYTGTYNYYPSDLYEFWVPMVEDAEGDSFFIEDHGLTTGDTISIATNSGTYGGYTGSNSILQHVGSTSPTNTTNLSSLADGSYNVDVISEDRFKLSGVRLSEAKGQYTFTGERRNSLANTFYLEDHGLISGTEVTVTEINGGTLPTSTSGQIIPYSSAGVDGTNVNSWSVLNDSINTYMAANTAGLQNMVTASNPNSTRVFNSGVSSGNSAMDYYDLYYTTNTVWYSNYGSLNPPSSNLNVGNFSSTRPYNILQGTNLADRNNMMVATDWSANSTLPYYFWTRESNRQTTSEYWYGYLRDGFGLPSPGSMQTYSTSNNRSNTINGNDYRWSTTWFKHVRSGGPSLCYMNGHFFNNSDWNVYTSNTGMTYSTNANTYWYSYWNGNYYWKDIIEFGLVWMVGESDTAFNSSTDFDNLMVQMLTDFDTNYIYPNLVAGNAYTANAITDNRIALEENGVQINLTNQGTGDFEFVTAAELGVIDGTYTTTASTEDTFTFQVANKIFGAQLDIDATTANTDGTIQIAAGGDHTLITGTAVLYDSNGNPDLTNLTNGSTYYAVVVDEQFLQFAPTEQDALNRDNIIELAAGTGTHKLSTSNVAGIAEAIGTVAVENGSNIIEGTETLFKRYFKVGDKIYVKDNSSTPGQLIERTITSISDDSKMTVDRQYDITNAATKHFLETKVYAKPDGYSVHRPFDGGVEIAAGTSPFSQVTRQTRKYFRYQSGKGIQTSLAINFNPPITFDNLSGAAGQTAPNETYNVANDGSVSWQFTEIQGDNPILTLYRGATYTFNVTATGHPFYFSTDSGDNYSSGTYYGEYTDGVTGSRTDSGTITFTVPTDAPEELFYFCGNHSVMYGIVDIEDYPANTATATTKYPHRLRVGSAITVKDASDPAYNGLKTVSGILDDFRFTYGMTQAPTSSVPSGIIKYNLNGYTDAYVRAGMFDQQNGFFFEYDGTQLYCVRRSSTTQLSGTSTLVNNSGRVSGDNSSDFSGQLSVGDYVVIRGQSYKVTKIAAKNEMYVQPQFKGVSTSGAILTKTEDVRVPQPQWNIDPCDGTGQKGFLLDINKIQMAYMDYSWYGAGKIRFGFKDAHGHVKYVHEFIHNNRLDEAYMRSGNLPAKYENENGQNPTYAPTLFHWGTSVIMDGTFDDDKAYLFTAPSKSLSFTNGESNTATTTGNTEWFYQYDWRSRQYDFWRRIPFSSSDSGKFYSGLKLYTTGGELDGDEVDYTGFSGSTFYVYIYIGKSRSYPAIYPTVASGTAVSLGAPASGGGDDDVNLGTDVIPLVSLRLAPSVDSNLSGNLGERDIINRMQLKLNEVGLILTHDCEVKLILNGDLSSIEWENVANPSLSQLIKHEAGDIITGGTEVFSFRAAGGSTDSTGKRLSNASNFSLGDIIDLGNSILGGNGTFPNGPDVISVAVSVVDTGGIGASQPFSASGRITWSESQA